MPQIAANGIAIEYEELGDPSDPAILLIMGLGAQLIYWPDAFCEQLAAGGFRVVRFDNRDVGLSTKFDHAGMPDLAVAAADAMRGRPVHASYTLFDLAADAIGVLDALDIADAHITGLSMGGMIAQIIAATYPERTRSLISIMSSTGRRGLPDPQADAFNALLAPRPKGDDRDVAIAHLMNIARKVSSPGFQVSEEEMRAKQERIFDRCYYPVGLLRHFHAILASGSREKMLHQVEAPTLVLHGSEDPLVSIEHGRDTAESVRNGTLKVIEGMAHDLPLAAIPILTRAMISHCRAA